MDFSPFLQKAQNDKSEFLRDFIVRKFYENLRGVLSLRTPNTKKFTHGLNFKALRLEKFLNRFLHSAWFVCVVDKLAEFRSPVNALSIGV